MGTYAHHIMHGDRNSSSGQVLQLVRLYYRTRLRCHARISCHTRLTAIHEGIHSRPGLHHG